MRLIIESPVCVITPTIGSNHLKQTVESVKNQTYKNINHLIVVDGKGYRNEYIDLLEKESNVTVVSLPFNTGGGGFNGQRIYAAFPHLIQEDYVLFLDEDNWWNNNHVESLIKLIEDKNLDWAYSLRKVYTNENFLADDCCESIGKYPIWFTWPDNPQYLIDTSSYCFTKRFILQSCHLWHSGAWGEDRRYFMAIKDRSNFETTGLHTLNYRLPDMNRAYNGDMQFFEKGNAAIKNIYGGNYPWLKH